MGWESSSDTLTELKLRISIKGVSNKLRKKEKNRF
jgi:hypothetical protein